MARWWTPGEKAPKYRWARSKAVSFLGFVEGLLSRDEAEALVKRSRVRK
jgi:hypothetical protein